MSHPPERHLDRFTRFCTAHICAEIADLAHLVMDSPNLDLSIIPGYFRPYEPAPQTASRSVQPFLRTPQQRLPMLFNGAEDPKNCQYPFRDRMAIGSSGPSESAGSAPKRYLDRFSCFFQGSRTWPTYSSDEARQKHLGAKFPLPSPPPSLLLPLSPFSFPPFPSSPHSPPLRSRA